MNSENMSYLLIDPFEKTISPVYYDGQLSSLYAMLKCDLVTVAPCGSFDLFVDDEGLFKADQRYFLADGYPQPLAGYALAVAVDNEGNTIPPAVTLEELEARVLWVDAIEWEGD